ncbi:MAG: heme ABC transporter permease CcmB [FCB group bacterium]|nr:heme ABC transporter permease CcmB [FCB group bacterium]
MASKTLAVLKKDIQSEYRTRYAINAILLFGVTTLTVVSFSVGQIGLVAEVYAALLWIILFFSAMSGLAQVFVKEEESKTAVVLRLTADPTPVFLGKLIFNFLLLILLEIVIVPLFFIMTDVTLVNAGLLLTILFAGSIGLAGATTLIAAIIARASVKGALFAVLSFPVLLPLLIGCIGGTKIALGGVNSSFSAASAELQLLFSYAVVMITAGLLLFEFVWEE